MKKKIIIGILLIIVGMAGLFSIVGLATNFTYAFKAFGYVAVTATAAACVIVGVDLLIN